MMFIITACICCLYTDFKAICLPNKHIFAVKDLDFVKHKEIINFGVVYLV